MTRNLIKFKLWKDNVETKEMYAIKTEDVARIIEILKESITDINFDDVSKMSINITKKYSDILKYTDDYISNERMINDIFGIEAEEEEV